MFFGGSQHFHFLRVVGVGRSCRNAVTATASLVHREILLAKTRPRENLKRVCGRSRSFGRPSPELSAMMTRILKQCFRRGQRPWTVAPALASILWGCSPLYVLDTLVPAGEYDLTNGISYGVLPRHKLDIYRPATATPPSARPTPQNSQPLCARREMPCKPVSTRASDIPRFCSRSRSRSTISRRSTTGSRHSWPHGHPANSRILQRDS